MALPQPEHKLRLPTSLRLLLSPGTRIHSLVFGVLTFLLIATGFLGKAAGFSSTWATVFVGGSTLALTNLVLAPTVLSEKARRYLLFSKVKTRITIILSVYGTIFAVMSYWTWQAGSVEALPMFPLFLSIFYAWIILQPYFIAAPVTHALAGVEIRLSRDGLLARFSRKLGIGGVFFPIIPLLYGVWSISVWLNGTYQGVQDASLKILLWTAAMTAAVLLTFFLVVSWTWPTARHGRPQIAVFSGGTFAVVWGYLLYRSTIMIIGYISQAEPESPLLAVGLMLLSIFGAMQTFARKTANRADNRWSQLFPFTVFAFGAIYTVAELYFIIQIPVTPTGLSIIINGIVFSAGLVTMMLLIRKHIRAEQSLNPKSLAEKRVQSPE